MENCLKLKDFVVLRDCFLLHQWCTTLGAWLPWRLNFERWRLKFVDSEFGTCFISLFWRLKVWSGSLDVWRFCAAFNFTAVNIKFHIKFAILYLFLVHLTIDNEGNTFLMKSREPLAYQRTITSQKTGTPRTPLWKPQNLQRKDSFVAICLYVIWPFTTAVCLIILTRLRSLWLMKW